jgi:hypothetical protein
MHKTGPELDMGVGEREGRGREWVGVEVPDGVEGGRMCISEGR